MNINDLLLSFKHKNSYTLKGTNTIQIITDDCYMSNEILDLNGNRYCDISLFKHHDDVIEKSDIVFYGNSSSNSHEIEIIYTPKTTTRQILYDVYLNGKAEFFVVDYTNAESVFQQSLIYNFELCDPAVPKIFKILDSINVDFAFDMCIRTKYLDNLMELFGL